MSTPTAICPQLLEGAACGGCARGLHPTQGRRCVTEAAQKRTTTFCRYERAGPGRCRRGAACPYLHTPVREPPLATGPDRPVVVSPQIRAVSRLRGYVRDIQKQRAYLATKAERTPAERAWLGRAAELDKQLWFVMEFGRRLQADPAARREASR